MCRFDKHLGPSQFIRTIAATYESKPGFAGFKRNLVCIKSACAQKFYVNGFLVVDVWIERRGRIERKRCFFDCIVLNGPHPLWIEPTCFIFKIENPFPSQNSAISNQKSC